jgi:hypothetical protein
MPVLVWHERASCEDVPVSRAAEAQRQSALLAAVLAGHEPSAPAALLEQGERLRRGLVAYRANAEAMAERALQPAYPTVAAMVGEEDFAALARALWRASPPQRGDLAQWGLDLPDFIEAQRDLDPWPYLADCARLDAALRLCEAASDAAPEPDTLALLAEHDPDALCLRLLPCVQLIQSRWPIATLHAAHQRGDAGDLDTAREALAECRAEAVVVARQGWRARVSEVDAPSFAWMRALHDGLPLSAALNRAGDAFTFDGWLVRALQQVWLHRCEPREVDPDPASCSVASDEPNKENER